MHRQYVILIACTLTFIGFTAGAVLMENHMGSRVVARSRAGADSNVASTTGTSTPSSLVQRKMLQRRTHFGPFISSDGTNVYALVGNSSASTSGSAWEIVQGADPSSFKSVPDQDNPVILDVNQDTGEPWYGEYFVDGRSVYVLIYSRGEETANIMRRLDGLDPKTFKIVPAGSYYRDSYVFDDRHVFYIDSDGTFAVVIAANPSTFAIDNIGAQWDARDANGCFFRGVAAECSY